MDTNSCPSEAFCIRACCLPGATHKQGSGYVEPVTSHPNRPSTATHDAPVLRVAVPDAVPSRRMAWHEAGHVIAGMAFGEQPERVWIGPQARAVFAGPANIDWRADVVTYLAGPLAERWSWRDIFRPTDGAIQFYVNIVRSLKVGNIQLGNCDYCRIFLLIIVNNINGDDQYIIDIYRNIENIAIAFVSDHRTERLIERLADALLNKGELDADAITSLVGADIPLLRVPQF